MMMTAFRTPPVRYASLMVAVFIASSWMSFGCKARRENSGVRSADVHSSDALADDEKPLPDYTPRFLEIDAGSPPFAQFDSEVTKVLLPDKNTHDLSLVSAQANISDQYRYFFSIYSWQGLGPFNLPRNTHVFGVFVRLDGKKVESDPMGYFTISWDAADGDIALVFPAKAGHNFSLSETYRLRERMSAATEVRRSRMVEIKKEVYDAAFAHYTRIVVGESTGIVSYKMLDDLDARERVRRFSVGGYSNCQHAIADILSRADGTLLETLFARGFEAGDMIYQWLSPHFVSTDPRLEVIGQRLRLQKSNN